MTNLYHFVEARAAADAAGIPLILISIDSDAARDVSQLLDDRLRNSPVTVIVADPSFIQRLRDLATEFLVAPDRIRYVVARDAAAVGNIDPTSLVILTRAAHDQLGGRAPAFWMLHSPRFATETITQLCTTLAHLNLAA